MIEKMAEWFRGLMKAELWSNEAFNWIWNTLAEKAEEEKPVGQASELFETMIAALDIIRMEEKR